MPLQVWFPPTSFIVQRSWGHRHSCWRGWQATSQSTPYSAAFRYSDQCSTCFSNRTDVTYACCGATLKKAARRSFEAILAFSLKVMQPAENIKRKELTPEERRERRMLRRQKQR